MKVSLRTPEDSEPISGGIQGIRSKSVSNRLLIQSALSGSLLPLDSLSRSEDTRELHEALKNPSGTHRFEGGTSARFFLAYRFAINRSVVLDPKGSLWGRPIGPLVEALTTLGGNFEYTGEEGALPVRFTGRRDDVPVDEVTVDCRISSQFASAIALICPALSRPLRIHLEHPVASRSYLEMTLKLMRQNGADIRWNGDEIQGFPSTYSLKNIRAEGDWSGASFFYAMVGLVPGSNVFIPHLSKNSLQPDSILPDWFGEWNVESQFVESGVRIEHVKGIDATRQFLDFSDNPDLALPIIIYCALQGFSLKATGLHTLPHKESDRLKALKSILLLLGAQWNREGNSYWLHPSRTIPDYSQAVFSSLEDHRIAMSLAMLGAKYPIQIEAAEVVEKSCPHFWEDLKQIGIGVKKTI